MRGRESDSLVRVFDGRFRAPVERAVKPLGDGLRRTGLSPDHLTILGLLLGVAAAIAIGMGALRAGLLLVVLAALPDLLDGALAKASNQASQRGAFFDSVIDRVTDALLLGGVAWYLASTEGAHMAMLPFAIMAASAVVSYERAKAESLGLHAKGGLMERAERIVLLCIGLLFDSILVAVLWVMLVLTVFTAVQRFFKVWNQAGVAPVVMERRRRGGPGGSPVARPARSGSTTCAAAGSPSPARPRLPPPSMSPVQDRGFDRIGVPAYKAASLAAQNLPEPVTSFAASDARRRLRCGHASPAVDDRAPPAPRRPVAAGPRAPPGGPGRVRLLRPLLGRELPPARADGRGGRRRLLLRRLRARRRRAGRRARRDRRPAPPRRLGVGRSLAGRPGARRHGRRRAAGPAGALRVVRVVPPLPRHDGRPRGSGRRHGRRCGRCGPTRSSASSPTATSRAAASRSSSSASARRCPAGRRPSACGPARRSCRPRCTSPRAGRVTTPSSARRVPAERHGSLRDDVQRITQLLAAELEALIRAAPEQWHLFQPNWPSDPGYGL